MTIQRRMVIAWAALVVGACSGFSGTDANPAVVTTDGGGEDGSPITDAGAEDGGPTEGPPDADAGPLVGKMLVFVSHDAVTGDSLVDPSANLCDAIAKNGEKTKTHGSFITLLERGGVDPFVAFAKDDVKTLRWTTANEVAFSGPLTASTNLTTALTDENGITLGPIRTWTGAKMGDGGLADCAGWTGVDAGATGMTGENRSGGTHWWSEGTIPCSTPAHLYCVEIAN